MSDTTTDPAPEAEQPAAEPAPEVNPKAAVLAHLTEIQSRVDSAKRGSRLDWLADAVSDLAQVIKDTLV